MSLPDPPHRPSFQLPVSEMIFNVAFLAALWSFLLPAINRIQKRKGEPLVLPWLSPLYEDQPWYFILGFTVLAVCLFSGCVLVIRRWLPPRVRAYFPWRKPRPE